MQRFVRVFNVRRVATGVCFRSLHTSPRLQQSTSPPRPPPPSSLSSDLPTAQRVSEPRSAQTSASPAVPAELPSIDPVLAELRTIVTRRYPIGELYRALSPASRKILMAHKLPLEELLLYLPHNFALYRAKHGKQASTSGALTVCPPHLLNNYPQLMASPVNGKAPPNIVRALGATVVEAALAAIAAASPSSKVGGGGFMDSSRLPAERLEEVLTYVPNEWTPFAALGLSREVKQRCMGYPQTRPATFFLNHPKHFEVRFPQGQALAFEVRRSALLQEQLQKHVTRPNKPGK